MSNLPPKVDHEHSFHPNQSKPYTAPNQFGSKTSGRAIASLVLGLTSFVFACFTGILAVFFGIIALVSISKSQGRIRGNGLAIGGIATGVLGCVIGAFMIFPAVWQVREAARIVDNENRMRQIAISMHDFHDSFGHLPAPDPKGSRNSQLSWRVQLLPFLEEKQLYEEFNHNEPWDSPHNMALIDRMPDVFKCNNHSLDSGMTCVMLPVTRMDQSGKPDFNNQAIFTLGRRKSLNSVAAQDGTRNTIMLLEVNPDAAVIWTKPANWEFDPNEPFRDLGKTRRNRICVSFADTSTDTIPLDAINAKEFKAWLTVNGNDGNRPVF